MTASPALVEAPEELDAGWSREKYPGPGERSPLEDEQMREQVEAPKEGTVAVHQHQMCHYQGRGRKNRG